MLGVDMGNNMSSSPSLILILVSLPGSYKHLWLYAHIIFSVFFVYSDMSSSKKRIGRMFSVSSSGIAVYPGWRAGSI